MSIDAHQGPVCYPQATDDVIFPPDLYTETSAQTVNNGAHTHCNKSDTLV